MRMKRTIFRVSKGRAYPTFFEFYPVYTLQNQVATKSTQIVLKKIYIIFYQGTMQNLLLSKILKVCEIFNASRFEVPDDNEFHAVVADLNKEIEEKNLMLKEVHNSSLDFIRNKVGTVSLF